jgi:hypothetical protein
MTLFFCIIDPRVQEFVLFFRSKTTRQGQRGAARAEAGKSGQEIKPRMGQQFLSRFLPARNAHFYIFPQEI